MKKINGIAFNIEKYIIGKITYKNNPLVKDKFLVCSKVPKILFGVSALILKEVPNVLPKIPVFICDDTDLFEDDIVNINSDGFCNVLWESNAVHNALYITDACNSKCIMCPQPMPKNPKNYFEDNLKLINLLNPKLIKSIGVTGGEPTLNIKELGIIIAKCKNKCKDASINILTNGRTFEDKNKVKELTNICDSNITYGIPLYSDNADEHDYIVGVKGSFNQTIRGLYNLAKENQMVEIRIVVLKQNYKKLQELAEFIYRNMPFVVHVAIMSMEYIGTAEENFDNIFIDPIDYKNELYKAVQEFVRYDMNVSIYNTPLCLLDQRLWPFAQDSISEWKKTYTNNCFECSEKSKCCGVFSTSFIHSKNISKLKMDIIAKA